MLADVPLWKIAPFVRLVLPLTAGMAAADRMHADPYPRYIIPVLAACLLFFHHTRHRIRFTHNWIGGILIHLLLFFTGYHLYHHNKIIHHPHWLGHHLHSSTFLIVTPAALPTPGKRSNRMPVKVMGRVDNMGQLHPATGNLLLYTPLTDIPKSLPGDWMALPASAIKKLQSAGNPGSFDYARYCSRKNLYHQAYLLPHQYQLIRKSGNFNLQKLLVKGQVSALSSIRATVPPSAQALAMALLIGYRGELDKELLQAYANTGVVHVIAVSGMHLGLIFLLLQHLLRFPVNRYPVTRWFKALLVVGITWWFSGVAGMAPSISRAAFMFSMALLATLLHKKMDPFQSLSLGAFVLLCYDPYWLWDAGFQLSFAALLSIVVFQPLIAPILHPHNRLLRGAWQLTATTLAAQLFTLPISIVHFHQAPLYFLAANLFAVPLSSLALVAALVQWIVSACNIPLTIPGKLTGLLIHWMDNIILHIDKIPGSVLTNLEWNTGQTVAAYLFILAGRNLFRSGGVILFLCSVLHIAGWHYARRYATRSQELLVVYHLPRAAMAEIITGEKCYRLFPPAYPSATAFGATTLSDAHRYFRIRQIRYLPARLLKAGNMRLAIARTTQQLAPLLELQPDLLLLTGTVKAIEPILHHASRHTTIILDGSLPEYRARKWHQLLQAKGIPAHNTWTDGALLRPFVSTPASR